METNLILKLVSIGLCGGVLSGMFGIGGGIVIVPLLTFFIGLSQVGAQGVSVGALLLPVGILAAVKYHKAGNFQWNYSVYIALGMFFGAYVGALLANSIEVSLLKKIFGFLLFGVGAKLIFF